MPKIDLKADYVPPVNIPAYYTVNMSAGTMLQLIVSLRAAVKELDVSQETVDLLAALEDVYVGDQPEGIFAPITDDGEAGEGGALV